MRMNASVLAIVFVLFLGSKRYLQGVRAYPPTDMKSHSLAVHNDGDNDGAIYIEPQHNKPIYIRRQTKQKNERTAPVTSSVTVTTNSTSSMPSTVKAAPATTEKPQLKSAFVYRAELPTPPERETEHPINAVNTVGTTHSNVQSDADLMKKVIGSSVVTSVSVVLNGDEPEFTDALGHKVPKPQPSLQVASPIDLLNPDRYEFFTFDEKGELVKRLMTMEQIQSIVANGDGDGPAIIHEEVLEDQNPEKNVQSILKSVQSVLDKEVESNKNATMNVRPVLDTPDVSSTWSMILPAIFGNTGDDIFPHQKPQQIVMTPDSEIIETYTKSSVSTAASTRIPKPSKRRPGVKRKPTTTTTTTELAPQVVQEELGPHESVYTGMQQYQDLAATMQNFDRVSQFHVHPIYQKLPEATIMDTASMSSTEHATLDESFSTRPDQVNAIKTTNNNNVHNAASSKRPYISKQKIKKKPLTSTTTVTPESLPKDTVTQKDSLTTIELSTKTSNIVNLQSSVTPLIKKKKKRPTRKPVQQTQTQPLVDYNPNLVEKQPAQDLPIIIMSLPIDLPADSNEYQDVMSINSLLSRINTTTTSSTYQPLPSTTFQLKPSVTQSPLATIPSAQQIKTTTPPPPTTTIDYDESPVITEASNVAIPGYPLHILPLSAQESEETDLNHSFTQEEEDLHTLASFDKIMQSLTQSNTLINTFTDSLNMSTDAVPLNKTEQVEESEETDSREKVDVKVTTLPSDTLSADGDNPADNKSQESHLIAHDFVTDSPINDKFDDINGTTLTMHESITEFSKAEDEEIETSEDPSDNPFHNAIETTAVQDAVTDPTWHNTEDASQEITYKPESVNTNVAFTLESDEAETTDFTDQMSTTEVFKDVKAEDGTSTNSLFYKVESPIPQHDSMVVDLQPALNMDVVKPTEQITMSDFQTQAATVASTLVDGSHSLDLNLKANSNRDKDEIQILMSDVLQQVNEHDNVIKKNTHFYDNRLSNIAQFNSSFLSMQPLKEILRNRTASYTNEDGEQHKLNDFPNNDNLADNLTNIESIAFKSEITEEYGAVDDISNTESPPATTENISIGKIHEIAITTTAQIDSDRTSTPLPIIDTNKLQNASQSNSKEEDVDSEEDKMEDVLVTDFTKPNVLISPSVNVNASEIHNQNENQSGQADNGSSFETIYMDSATLSHIDNYFKEGNTAAPVSSSNEEDKIIEKPENWSYLQPENGNQSDDNETNGNRKSDLDKTNDLNEYIEMTKVEIPIDNIKMTDNSEIAVKIHETTEAVMKYTESETGTADPLRTLDVNQDISTGKINTHLDSSIDTQYPIEAQENTNLLDKESFERNATNSAELPDRQTSSSQKPTNAASHESISVTTTTNYDISEEKSPTLNSTSLESEGFDDSFDEDPYIKLGETTQRSTYTPQSSTAMPNPVNSAERETDSIPHNVKVSQSPSTENHSLESINVVQTDVASNQDIDRTVEKHDGDKVAKPTLPITSTPSIPTIASTTRRLITLKPVSYYNKQPPYTLYQEGIESFYNKYVPLAPYIQQSTTTTSKNHTHGAPVSLQSRPMQRPPQLINLMAISTQATRPPVKLEPSPLTSKGLLASVANLDEDVSVFTQLCNELAFSYWKSITSEKISSARSLVVAPFALTSMLSMIFLGARGGTSGEMNDVLRLDDMVSFNPHLIFKNITESVEKSTDNNIATAAFVRQLYSDRVNGKIMQFFKEKVQQLYSGHVEEVNFHVVNDIIRRRTNLLMKRHTMGKVLEYLRTNSVWVNGPLATISANLFQTNCSEGSTQDRDGEMFFQVHPSVRQRRLVPIPAVLFKSGFTVGYEPNLDATLVAFGRIQDTLSTIYIMPGHQNTISPSDNLDRLEKELMQTAISKNAWNNLLTSLMDRPGMEVQLPRFSHRSFVNATLGLQKMGLKGLFKSDYADLGGLTGSSNRDIYLSDIIQINTFSTCGEERIADHHHVEMYPAPPLRKRNKNVDPQDGYDVDSSEAVIDFGSLVQETALGRGFYDDLLDPKYLELPLPLRPRQARVPDTPRLRFDKPFLYFLRHNPTGMIMFIGRFNPRLLP